MKHPAGDRCIKHHKKIAADQCDNPMDMPFLSGFFQCLVGFDRTFLAGTSNRKHRFNFVTMSQSIVQNIQQSVAQHGANLAFQFEGQSYTYRDFELNLIEQEISCIIQIMQLRIAFLKFNIIESVRCTINFKKLILSASVGSQSSNKLQRIE